MQSTRPAPPDADLSTRLQHLVSGWRGAERGQPLSDLHAECVAATGPGGRHALPAALMLVEGLDVTTLRTALMRTHGLRESIDIRFRVRLPGRFDAALVPIRSGGDAFDRWVLAIEATLPLPDQIALYGHALGHLLLNRELRQLGQLPPLDPVAGYAHADTIEELRMQEAPRRSPIDRRVLESYPLLTELLRGREESLASIGVAATELHQRLAQAGWRVPYLEAPYQFTAGRVYVTGTSVRRGTKLRADGLLRAEPSLPIALVQAQRVDEPRAAAEQRLVAYARDRLHLPFAYLLDTAGGVEEFDFTTAAEPARRTRAAVPDRQALLGRWLAVLGLTDARAREALAYPYRLSGQRLRYYQEAAVNRAIITILQARRNLCPRRALLTLATGTGKTRIAFQIIWKLKKARAIGNVLYITDRDYLLTQAMDNEFAPFGDARHRVQGAAATSRDIFFATYQAIAEGEGRRGLFRDYQPNFFDLVIVDECHRGSAQDESTWRRILEYFDSAVQLGMTATPLRDDNVQTYEYFGNPLVSYSLRTGINDGFLAPYRVRRVLLRAVQAREDDGAGASDRTSQAPAPAQDDAHAEDLPSPAIDTPMETAAQLRENTGTIARHLAAYIRRSDPLAKTIVFCVDQDHAEAMRVALAQACAEETQRYPGYIVRIVSDEGGAGRRQLGLFSTPGERTPVLVTTSKLLSTGIDVPTCKNIVLARPVGSIVEFKQMIGRGTRLLEPEKTWFTIVDYAGAIHHFFDAAFDGDPELVEIEPLTPLPTPESQADAAGVPEPVGATAGPPAGNSTEAPRAPASGDSSALPNATPPAGSGDGMAVSTDFESLRSAQHTPMYEERDLDYSDGEFSANTPAPAVAAGAGAEPASSIGDESAAPTASAPADALAIAPAETSGLDGVVPVPTVPAPPAPPAITATRLRDGLVIKVVGEIVMELAPDGHTLRTISYRDYTRAALHGLTTTPQALIARWLQREQREEIRARLEDEGIDLDALAAALGQPDLDPLDLLLQIAFGERSLTRRERADRLRREQAAFFARYGPAAREILEIVLDKYVAGEAPDISDPQLLRVPPLSERGTFLELAQPFGGGAKVRAALRELQELLYSA